MDAFRRYLPFLDLAGTSPRDLSADLFAGIGVALVAVPQAIAYAMIAGLPPATGLYAAAVPAMVGALFRSSRHVITGPSNALSLLVGTAVVAANGGDPVQTALTLAILVGILQLAAGVLGLGLLVDFISRPVVLGYITGAGVLILIGQLPNVTATGEAQGHVAARVMEWAQSLGEAHGATVVMALATAGLMLLLRRIEPRAPGAIVAMALGVGAAFLVDMSAWGVPLVSDLTPVPPGLPPLTIPDLGTSPALLSAAVACAVLSLVEGTSVARAVAEESGQPIERSVELTGQGLANVAAAFTGGYPTSGSVARSALNRQLGARTRVSGLTSGLIMVAILLVLGPVVDHTPIAVLAGILLVIAVDLVDLVAIRRVLRSHATDRLAFLGTLLGTFALRLDHAIYLGVAISVVMFLRRARTLLVQEMVVSQKGRLLEVRAGSEGALARRCPAIRILQVEGALFFGAAGDLRKAIDTAIEPEEVRVLVVRVKRAMAMDITTAGVFEATAKRLRDRGGKLLLVGMRERAEHLLERIGAADVIGRENLFPTEPGIFVAMRRALEHATEITGPHACGDACPIPRLLTPQ